MIQKNIIKDWRLHAMVLAIVIIAELIGRIDIPVGNNRIVLIPLLYALVLGLLSYFTPMVSEQRSTHAEPMILLGLGVLMAKIGTVIGPQLNHILSMGPALLLQEIGNLGTILLGLPLAILLGFKRESIGMTHSLGREPNLGLVAQKYGLNSEEGRGLLAIYIFGILFGAIFLGLLAGILAEFTPLSIQALAMASGVGSASMMAAASGTLIALSPENQDQIVALAGASNLISTVTGIYVSIFIGLPLCEFLYRHLNRLRGNKK
ncbi:DUF3100 domain-containing protein [Basilea psittacipulmonis]|uniref:Membrane protein n=1 Tax=Basilea psittacipulmonis DSM 24701 TaxID=1072685 RepID=A0A077DII7_9BURK|nr:DUF3100 domain-containing protein [Basilea psittacipulmonis]AIL33282.1 membrane protein [Basilea psittacipulmonis DSM 24701]